MPLPGALAHQSRRALALSPRPAPGLSIALLLLLSLASLPALASAQDASDTIIAFLEQHHALDDRDIDGRLALASWCESRLLYHQQTRVLAEVVHLNPHHPTAYRDLLKADARRSHPVDRRWADRLQQLFGPRMRLHHGPRYTLITDLSEDDVQAYLDALESAYASFYRETSALGLRPLPPDARLVCIFFERHSDYDHYLRRYEAIPIRWSDGLYSWRTNRMAFFHDRDHPAFREVRDDIEQIHARIDTLRRELAGNATTARRFQIQQELRQLHAAGDDLSQRLGRASQYITYGKVRHEAVHQLAFNSGLQQRGRIYPFWFNEGFAALFEVCDDRGNAGPRFVNAGRLWSYNDVATCHRLLSLHNLLNERPGPGDQPLDVSDRYAQVWALMHFLWNRHPARLRAYIESQRPGNHPDPIALFRRYFGPDLASIERDFRTHVDSLRPRSTTP